MVHRGLGLIFLPKHFMNVQQANIWIGFPSRVGQVSDSVTRHFEAHMQDFENA